MEVNNSATFGARVRTVRLGKRITLRELAKRLGISPAFQTQIEKDQSVPTSELIERIAKELELDANELCGLAGKLTPDAQRTLSRLARRDPKIFRSMIERMGGA